jgi:hypothetical protein
MLFGFEPAEASFLGFSRGLKSQLESMRLDPVLLPIAQFRSCVPFFLPVELQNVSLGLWSPLLHSDSDTNNVGLSRRRVANAVV